MDRRWVSSPTYEAAIGVLIDARKAANLTQRDLAERLGKPRSFVSKIEVRERRIDIIELIAIAEALDRDPSALFTEIVSSLVRPLEY